MAKMTVKNFLKEMVNSIVYSVYLDDDVIMRQIAVNSFCASTTDADKDALRKNYIAGTHKLDMQTSRIKPTFANTVGMNVLNIFNWPYAACFAVRQAWQKTIDQDVCGKMGRIERTPVMPLVAKALVAVLILPFEIPAYMLAKTVDTIVSAPAKTWNFLKTAFAKIKNHAQKKTMDKYAEVTEKSVNSSTLEISSLLPKKEISKTASVSKSVSSLKETTGNKASHFKVKHPARLSLFKDEKSKAENETNVTTLRPAAPAA